MKFSISLLPSGSLIAIGYFVALRYIYADQNQNMHNGPFILSDSNAVSVMEIDS